MPVHGIQIPPLSASQLLGDLGNYLHRCLLVGTFVLWFIHSQQDLDS